MGETIDGFSFTLSRKYQTELDIKSYQEQRSVGRRQDKNTESKSHTFGIMQQIVLGPNFLFFLFFSDLLTVRGSSFLFLLYYNS